MEINESCWTEEGVESRTRIFKHQTNLMIALTCQISSKKVNCGGTRFITGESAETSITPAKVESLENNHYQSEHLWKNISISTNPE